MKSDIVGYSACKTNMVEDYVGRILPNNKELVGRMSTVYYSLRAVFLAPLFPGASRQCAAT